MITTIKSGIEINDRVVDKYFKRLVGRFFKILPMKENKEDTLDEYMRGLQIELIGITNLLPPMQTDADYLSLMAILQYLIDTPDCGLKTVKREVFTAIPICKAISQRYFPESERESKASVPSGCDSSHETNNAGR